MKSIIFLISLIYLTQGYVIRDGKCPDVDVVTNLNYEKLNGFWYPIEAYPSPYDEKLKCLQDDFHFNDNGTAIVNFKGIDVSSKEEVNLSYTLEPKGDAKTGNYLARMEKTEESPAVEGSWKILDTDYENYIVVWSCDEIDSKTHNLAWIESRSRTLSKDYLKKVYDVFDKYGLDKAELKKSVHENCD